MQVEELQRELRILSNDIENLLNKFSKKTGYRPIVDIEPITFYYVGSQNGDTLYSVSCRVSVN